MGLCIYIGSMSSWLSRSIDRSSCGLLRPYTYRCVDHDSSPLRSFPGCKAAAQGVFAGPERDGDTVGA